jgi:hypothetical protein
MDRGLDMSEDLYDHELPPTSVLRGDIARSILHPTIGRWRVGVGFGLFAREFGARAPVWQIAKQLLDYCVHITYIDEDTETVGWHCAIEGDGGYMQFDFSYFAEVDHGIEIAVIDWWLADSDAFVDAYRIHCQMVMETEAVLHEAWFCWQDTKGYCYADQSSEEVLEYEQELLARRDETDRYIEVDAIRIGL